MITSEQITEIITELGLDPADTGIRQTIERIVAAKPDAKIDARFLAALRQELQTKAGELTSEVPNHASYNFDTNNKQTNYLSMFMNKVLVFALVAVVVLAGGGLWYLQQTGKPLIRTEQNDIGQLLSGEYGVTSLEQESFGNLATLAIVDANTANRLQSGGGTGAGTGTAGGGLGNGGPEIAIAPTDNLSILPYPGSINFEFNYEGQDLGDLPATQDVYQRIKPQQSPALVERILNFLSFGLIDLSRFAETKLQNFSFVEDRDYGYGLNVDVMQGSVSMYQNWEKWPQPYGNGCARPAVGAAEQANPSLSSAELCRVVEPMKPEDMPSNDELIVAADNFLAIYGVSRTSYGEPKVMDTWRAQSIWVPDQVQVIYPFVLEGKEVLDEGGNPSGLSVTVDARTKRVTSLYELTTKQFERSQYAGETDAKKIVDVAERGGFRNYMYNDPNGKKTVLDLDTPSLEMVKIWYSADNYRSTKELYVPAYVFPIKNWEEAGYWRQNVIVPLVKDVLDSDQSGGGGGQPPVMPLGSEPVSVPPAEPVIEPTLPVEPDGGNGNTTSSR